MSEMEREEELHKELMDLSAGFPEKLPVSAPDGYFEELPDRVISRWKDVTLTSPIRNVSWLRMIAAAAVVTGISLGVVWWTNQGTTNMSPMAISSTDAYQYILENIDEFEPLLLNEELKKSPEKTGTKESQAIEQYLIEEMEGSDIETIF